MSNEEINFKDLNDLELDKLKDIYVDSRLKNMSEDDLKAFYKQKLRADSEEGSKGAGVGLIEIARKSSEFDFDFIDLNDGTSFFLLRSILK